MAQARDRHGQNARGGRVSVPSASPTILYVGSYGRSGSTLLGRVLAEAPGTVCLGETRYVWSRGLLDNAQCGCGVPFRSCPFWTAVGVEAFDGWAAVDAERLSELDRQTNLLRALPFYGTPGSSRACAR